uniref:Uncharacterized protein n=1 Tax=Panagrolaimus sp. ES5 TaxID=591445 RepID=A0AC34F9B7_9BILA
MYYILLLSVIFVAAIEFSEALKPKDKYILQQLMSFEGLTKRRSARELLGKRSAFRGRELWGKRSAPPMEPEADYLIQGLQNENESQQWLTTAPKKRDGRELLGKRYSPTFEDMDDKGIAYLISILNNKRERRARSNELLG